MKVAGRTEELIALRESKGTEDNLDLVAKAKEASLKKHLEEQIPKSDYNVRIGPKRSAKKNFLRSSSYGRGTERVSRGRSGGEKTPRKDDRGKRTKTIGNRKNREGDTTEGGGNKKTSSERKRKIPTGRLNRHGQMESPSER